jgi:hypothetical protein
LTRAFVTRILVVMKRIVLLFALVVVAVAVGLAQPNAARAGWCWPNCYSYGILGPNTSTYNACFYSYGEVCSGWSYWSVNGISKTCYPGCDYWGYTPGSVLYGFENWDRIRGRVLWTPSRHYISPSDVGMGGYLRAQVLYWQGAASQINASAIG